MLTWPLANCDLSGALFDHANLSGAQLFGSNLMGANFMLANLSGAKLMLANLSGGGVLSLANLSGADLTVVNLRGAYLAGARMDATTNLSHAQLGSHTYLGDVVWNGIPLTRLNWEDVTGLGEEQVARDAKDASGKQQDSATRVREYADAVLAYRQVATVLRSQGLNEHADRFAYRAQLCQRVVLRRQHHYLRYLGSMLLWLIAGYGYRPLRAFVTYLLVVTLCGLAFWALGIQTGHLLTWNEAGVVSLTAFHGRGFFATAFQPGDPPSRRGRL
jgi:hypothetical protein